MHCDSLNSQASTAAHSIGINSIGTESDRVENVEDAGLRMGENVTESEAEGLVRAVLSGELSGVFWAESLS